MASEQDQEQRIERLHVKIGQLFEANTELSLRQEQFVAAIKQRDEIIASLRQAAAQASAPVQAEAPPVPAPNREQRRRAARK